MSGFSIKNSINSLESKIVKIKNPVIKPDDTLTFSGG